MMLFLNLATHAGSFFFHSLVDALIWANCNLEVLGFLLALREVDADVLGQGELHQIWEGNACRSQN